MLKSVRFHFFAFSRAQKPRKKLGDKKLVMHCIGLNFWSNIIVYGQIPETPIWSTLFLNQIIFRTVPSIISSETVWLYTEGTTTLRLIFRKNTRDLTQKSFKELWDIISVLKLDFSQSFLWPVKLPFDFIDFYSVHQYYSDLIPFLSLNFGFTIKNRKICLV